MKIKEIFEGYGSAKYGLRKSTPEDSKKKQDALDQLKSKVMDLTNKMYDAAQQENWDLFDELEKKLKLTKAMYANTHAFTKGNAE